MMTDSPDFPQNATQRDALALIRAATDISRARKQNDKDALTVALDKNLQLWTGIRTLMEKREHPLPERTKENLIKLSRFVIAKTISDGCDASDKTLDALENMNLQIAQGLTETLRPPAVRENAAVLIQTAQKISQACKSNDKESLAKILDENLHLWIALKTLAETNRLGIDGKNAGNIVRLAGYVSAKTFESGVDADEKTLESFINVNMQIAQGFLESHPLSDAEEDALSLLRAAMMLAEAKDGDEPALLAGALNHNMELWTGIKTSLGSKNHPMADDLKANLTKLADFSICKTFEIGTDTKHAAIDTLININLQISEGLLERIGFSA